MISPVSIPRRARLPLGACALALAVLAAPAPAPAALLVYEPFDYAAGADPSTAALNGGTGWAAGWGNRSGNVINAGMDTVGDSILAGSLGYSDGSGNMLVTGGNRLQVSGEGGTSNPFRNMSVTRGAAGTTTWVSFVGVRYGETSTVEQPNNPYPRAANFSLYQVNGSLQAERLALGGSTGMPDDTWSLIPRGGGGNRVGATPFVSQAITSLIVVRIDHIGDTTVSDDAYMWVNPALGSEPAIGTANAFRLGSDPTNADIFDYTIDAVRPFAGNFSAAQPRPFAVADYDEFRLGESFADVTPFTPIPEPTAALLAAGVLAATVLRRRRS
jgi:MYXO-CTERM domain-containing protein